MNGSSQYLACPLNYLVIEALTLPLHWWKSSVQHLAFKNAGLQPIMHNVMDKWRDFIKLYLE